MKGNIAIAFFIMFFSSLIVSCASAPPSGSPDTGYSITGFVRKSPSPPAISQTVMLLDGETGNPINSVQTNLVGRYNFSHLPPGVYLIRVRDITRKVILTDSSKRLDIEWNDCPECPQSR